MQMHLTMLVMQHVAWQVVQVTNNLPTANMRKDLAGEMPLDIVVVAYTLNE